MLVVFTMLGTFKNISNHLKLKPQEVSIDNLVSRLHYRATTLILFVASVLVTSRQYIGEHIACITDTKSVPENVMNTFCFFMATFTVRTNVSLHEKHGIPYLGVSAINSENLRDDSYVLRHNYYQWVPFVLFGQAIAFYLPHYIWKRKEDGRLRKYTEGFKYMAYSLTESVGLKTPQGENVPSAVVVQQRLDEFRHAFLQRLHVQRMWAAWFILCEILNAINLIVQIYLTNVFLSGGFYDLGPAAIRTSDMDQSVLDEIFPKITKCTFHKYGPSGSLQAHDAMCVLALNIINEKIFLVLWFWYLMLFIVTMLGLIWRIVTLSLHASSTSFNRWVFATSRLSGGRNPWAKVMKTSGRFHFTDWLFLRYLSKNLDGIVFQKLFKSLAKDVSNQDEENLINNDIYAPVVSKEE